MRLLKIGRAQTCDIVLHSDKVSSLHAELVMLDSGDIQLEDKSSRNGTFIMNQPIQPGKPVNVRRGDAIRFADVELQWSQVPMPEDNSAYKAIYGIGSNFQNDIQISGTTVSRYHATIKVGRDNKVYIVDHSKNGTTVDGKKIPSNTPTRIKKSSAVVCGGVPVNLSSQIAWPSNILFTLLKVAACLVVLVGIIFGAYGLFTDNKKKVSDEELYARYNKSVVMLVGIYHYEVSIGNLNMDKLNQILIQEFGPLGYIPKKLLPVGDKYEDVSNFTSRELVEALNKKGMYSGTGFFISPDGKLITNLHVVKPWISSGEEERLQRIVAADFAEDVELLNRRHVSTQLSAYLSQVKVKGVLDYVALVSQGEVFDPENIVKCRVLSAGDDMSKDVALVQTVSKRLPTGECTYVNVNDSIDTSDEALTVGKHVYTLGFPTGTNYEEVVQKESLKSGIQVIGQGGSIIQQNSEFDFGHNASTTGGASGSPIFNEYGMLIGVHHQGLSQVETQGYNYGVKAKYVKELLDSPYRVD